MDTISGLPNDVLVKILSFLPTKAAVSTSVLSKQWEFLWMWLPRLEFSSWLVSKPGLREFIYKNLPLHRDHPVIERLCLAIYDHSPDVKPEDIRQWIEVAVSSHVRELDMYYYTKSDENILPSSFFTCKSLVTLKLKFLPLMAGIIPTMVCLPSLKILEIETFSFAKSLQQLLFGCPVLEDLSLRYLDDEDIKEFTIIVPSLYEIDTPSLKYLNLVDLNSREHYALAKNMPKLKEAYVVSYNPKSLIGSITYDLYGDGYVFQELEHLNLCVCKKDSSNLIGQFLKDSPKLRVLDISLVEDHEIHEHNGMEFWNQPSHVPECLMSSLQTFKWSPYFGRQQDRDIAVYILKNARNLKMATILADTRREFVPNLEMIIEELRNSPRASSTCQLSIRR
ncbi:hypothetical protein CARUB_v10004993mg, partial [Capsella rubella]